MKPKFIVYVGNRITEKSLPLFLTSLEMQSDREGGLLRLCLQVCVCTSVHSTLNKSLVIIHVSLNKGKQ